jgi:Glycosyltransferase family 87
MSASGRGPVSARGLSIRRHAVSVATIAALAAVGGSFFAFLYVRARRPQGNDLTVYLRSAEALARGGDPYLLDVPQGHGPYPLTIDTLMIPLTWVPVWLAQAMWFGVNVAALLGSLWILDTLWRAAEPGENAVLRLPFAVRLVAVTLALLVPLQSHLTRGQVNLVVLWCCCLFLRAHLAERNVTAAGWLGGAIALKLTPLVLVIGLARERKYRTLAWTMVSALVWAVGLPALVVGGQVVSIYAESWTLSLGREALGPVSFDAWSRFTLAAALVRAWSPLAAIPGYRYLVTLAILAFLYWVQGRARGDDRRRLLVFALGIVAIPLIAPKSENHHLAMLAGPLWLWLLAAGSPPRRRALDVAAALAFLTLAWLGNRQPASLLDFSALAVLFGILTWRILTPERLDGAGADGDAPIDRNSRRRPH